jgi:hypothetical protein
MPTGHPKIQRPQVRLILPTQRDLKRFWVKVLKIHEGCWEWQKGRDKSGYGLFHIAGRVVKTHRLSWMLAHGEIEEGKLILHKCDNPKCVNPDHLFIGNHKDNMADCVNKGRNATGELQRRRPDLFRGENSSRAKLKESDVIQIRAMKHEGKTKIRDIAKMFNVSHPTVANICKGIRWAHVK